MQRCILVLLTGASMTISACGNGAVPEAPPGDVSAPPPVAASPSDNETALGATVALLPAQGHQAVGRLVLSQEETGARIRGEITGLEPNGEHGFHVHQTGDCSAPDAGSAGEHLNPGSQPHGNPSTGAHHAGDMLNLRANGEGTAAIDVVLASLTVGGGAPTDVIGKAVIVHAAADDYSSQPAGNSGARIACGVIE